MEKVQQKSKHNQNQRDSKIVLPLGSKASGLDQLLFSCCIIVEVTVLTGHHILSVQKHFKDVIDGL